jgi:hypothetical protein
MGDMSLPINIMDQNEGHFMLNELGGENSSGSMRAQIVDELGGVTGIEALIKEVSLDRHRHGRAMKENEDRANALRETMHDKSLIRDEQKLLDEVQELVSFKEESDQAIRLLADLFEEHDAAEQEAERISRELAALPNTKILKAILKKASDAMEDAERMKPLSREYVVLGKEISDLEDEIDAVPDVGEISGLLRDAEEDIGTLSRMSKAYDEYAGEVERLRDCEQELERLSNLDEIVEAVNDCSVAISEARRVGDLAAELAEALDEMDREEEQLGIIEEEMVTAVREMTEALSDVDVCPLTNLPISRECFKGLKFPVTETV